jgi:hypothetical protein
MKRKLVTVPDSEVEPFTKSECSCNICKEINECEKEWDTFSVKTNLQKRMKDVVLSIEVKADFQLEPKNIPSRKRKSRK